MLPTLRTVPIVLAAAGLLAPAAANAATKPVYPVVDSISPRKLAVGDQLTVKGKNLRAGAGKTTIVFQRTGKPAVFVKALSATKTRVTLRVPEKLQAFLLVENGNAKATTFRLRVLTTRFAKLWTSVSRSPVISPKAVPATPVTAPGTTAPGTSAPGTATPPVPELTPYEICQRDAPASPDADADSDGLTNGTELGLVNKTDPCNADTDLDGMVDGYEYLAAVDYNNNVVDPKTLPYPGKRPWPNPLDGSDSGYDFDGDGLQLWMEYKLWKFKGGSFPITQYSDGLQNTGGTLPAGFGTPGLDLDGDGNLTDDERDADGDELSNIVEFKLSGTFDWWTKAYKTEKPYTWAKFGEPDPLDIDTDGDGLSDGRDDQDQDGYDNISEMQDPWRWSGYRIQPYNPCLPWPYAATCGRYVPFDNPWPPFDGTVAARFDGQPIGSLLPLRAPDERTNDLLVTNVWNGLSGPQGTAPTAPPALTPLP